MRWLPFWRLVGAQSSEDSLDRIRAARICTCVWMVSCGTAPQALVSCSHAAPEGFLSPAAMRMMNRRPCPSIPSDFRSRKISSLRRLLGVDQDHGACTPLVWVCIIGHHRARRRLFLQHVFLRCNHAIMVWGSILLHNISSQIC